MKFLTQEHNQDLVIKQAYIISQENLLANNLVLQNIQLNFITSNEQQQTYYEPNSK